VVIERQQQGGPRGPQGITLLLAAMDVVQSASAMPAAAVGGAGAALGARGAGASGAAAAAAPRVLVAPSTAAAATAPRETAAVAVAAGALPVAPVEQQQWLVPRTQLCAWILHKQLEDGVDYKLSNTHPHGPARHVMDHMRTGEP
jgi:hypothetical protein